MKDAEPAGPEDPFPEVLGVDIDAAWLRELYDSYVDVGFTASQSLRLARDHLRWAYYGGGPEPEDTE